MQSAKRSFQLAEMLKRPVFFANCAEKNGKYFATIKMAEFAKSKRRGENLAREYAAFLEKSALDTPLQWFNFFDFFKS